MSNEEVLSAICDLRAQVLDSFKKVDDRLSRIEIVLSNVESLSTATESHCSEIEKILSKGVSDTIIPVAKIDNLCQQCQTADTYLMRHCPKCKACPQHQEVRNYSLMWHDGDVHCIKCEAFVRSFDAG